MSRALVFALATLLVTLMVACAAGVGSPTAPIALRSPSGEYIQAVLPQNQSLVVAAQATRPLDAISLDGLLYQPGDLPSDVRVGALDRVLPDWMKYKLPKIDAAAGLRFERAGMQFGYGSAQLLFDDDPSRILDLYHRSIGFEANQRQGVPLPNIGDEALLFLPQDPFPMMLFFHRCRTMADVQLRISPSEQPVILNYAARLAQRVDAVDCEGAAQAPVLTPPPPPPTFTPMPPIAVTQVISATVTRLPDPEGTNTIRGYAFADANHGWLALGAKIMATSDGGKTWTGQFEVDGRVREIGFVSPQVGWIELENGFLVTRDGGATWQRAAAKPDDGKMPPPPMGRAANNDPTFEFCSDDAPLAGPFAAIDQQTAWAICTGSPGSHYLVGGMRLFQTRDGGKHWQLITDRLPHGLYGVPDLFFLDEKHGWIATYNGGDGSVEATDDGGRTWRVIVGDLGEPRNIQFLTPSLGFVVFSRWSDNDNREALIRTDNAGVTWRSIYGVPPRAPWPGGPAQFFANGTGLGAGDGQYYSASDLSNNTLLSTHDAGQSWTEVTALKGWCPGDYAVRIGGLSFADRQHGWFLLNCFALPQPILYRTEDGGGFWQFLALPSGINGVTKGISFVDRETGFIVAGDGRLWRTDDGGATFALVDDAAVHTPSLRFATKELGWEIRGVDLHATTDGGHTWKPIAIGYPVQAFSLLPDGRAWVVIGDTPSAGNSKPARRLLTTSDDGRTWTEYRLGDLPVNWRYPWLDTIQFADAQHGWLKADTELYYTQDGGRHWTQLR